MQSPCDKFIFECRSFVWLSYSSAAFTLPSFHHFLPSCALPLACLLFPPIIPSLSPLVLRSAHWILAMYLLPWHPQLSSPLDRALPSRDRQTLHRMGGQFIELPESLLPLLPTTTLLRGLPSVEFSLAGTAYLSGRGYRCCFSCGPWRVAVWSKEPSHSL